MSNFERPNIRAMRGYSWGEQPDDASTIKLNTNENPFPPSPAVQRVLSTMPAQALRTYPQPTADPLRDAIAQYHRVTRGNVVVTNGGDEALRLAFTTFANPGGTFGMAEPSYSLYPVLAQVQGVNVRSIALDENWRLSADFAAKLQDADLTCVVNPHAPSGQLTRVDDLQRLANALPGVLLIDEAYVDFVDPVHDYHSETLLRCENVLILRTFSKGYGLAGLRLGYLLGHEGLIAPIVEKTRDSYNINHISQQIGLAALGDREYAASTWRQVREMRTSLQTNLLQLGLASAPSETNFVLVSVPQTAALDAESLYGALKRRGILVRYFAADRLRDKLRITVGGREQNAALVAALADLLAGATRPDAMV